jgi:hypothetical protein
MINPPCAFWMVRGGRIPDADKVLDVRRIIENLSAGVIRDCFKQAVPIVVKAYEAIVIIPNLLNTVPRIVAVVKPVAMTVPDLR